MFVRICRIQCSLNSAVCLVQVNIKVKHITLVYTASFLTHLETNCNLSRSFLCFVEKEQKLQGQSVPQQGPFKHSMLINSIFSLTHKHPVYHQALKCPLIWNLFFFRSRELAHLASRENTDLYCCILFWGGLNTWVVLVLFFFNVLSSTWIC